MLIGAHVAIEPSVGGFIVLVNGEEWRTEESEKAGESSVFYQASDAWAAYRRANDGEDTGLADMARDMVGDGKRPNLYFVTVDGKTLLATADMTVARFYAQNPEKMGVHTPSALEYPCQIEDRLNGLVWENGASIAEQEAEEEGAARCPHTHGGRHVLDQSVSVADYDSSDSKALVVDVSCRACGRSGSVTISPDDVMW